MQRNKSNEIARDIIRTAKETFNEKINNITLFNLTDEPYKMFSIKCSGFRKQLELKKFRLFFLCIMHK